MRCLCNSHISIGDTKVTLYNPEHIIYMDLILLILNPDDVDINTKNCKYIMN